MNELKIECTLTDKSTGKTVDIEELSEKERLKSVEKIAIRAMQTLYGPEYEVKINNP